MRIVIRDKFSFLKNVCRVSQELAMEVIIFLIYVDDLSSYMNVYKYDANYETNSLYSKIIFDELILTLQVLHTQENYDTLTYKHNDPH